MEGIRKYREAIPEISSLESDTFYVFISDELVVIGEFLNHNGNNVFLDKVIIFSQLGVQISNGYSQIEFNKFHCEPLTRACLVDFKSVVDKQDKNSKAYDSFYSLYTTLLDLDPV